jgi:hypothetical protein
MEGDFMRQTAFVAALFASAFLVNGSVAFAADPQLMTMVMPDARIMAGMNATKAKSSPFGQFVVSKVSLLGAEVQPLIAATGFDPFQDVSEVLAATAADPSKPTGILLVRGNFAPDKIGALVTGRTGVLVEPYDGSTLISLTNPNNSNKAMAVAFIGSSIAIAGDLASVKAAVDRNGGAVAIDPALAAQVSQLSSTEDAWVASSASLASLIPASVGTPATATGPAAQVMPILKSIQSFSGGVNFAANIQLSAQAVTNSPQNGAALGAVLQLGLNLLSMASTNNTQLAPLTQFAQTVQITPNGPAVSISASIPEAQAEALVNQVLKPATPAAVAGSSRPLRERRPANN